MSTFSKIINKLLVDNRIEHEILMARVADQSEKYEDMIILIKEIIWESSGEGSNYFFCFLNFIFINFVFINFISSRRYDWKFVQHEKYMLFLARALKNSKVHAKVEKEQ